MPQQPSLFPSLLLRKNLRPNLNSKFQIKNQQRLFLANEQHVRLCTKISFQKPKDATHATREEQKKKEAAASCGVCVDTCDGRKII